MLLVLRFEEVIIQNNAKKLYLWKFLFIYNRYIQIYIYIYIYIHNIYIYIIYNIYIYLYLYKWSQMSHDIYKLYSIEDTIFPRECDWIARNLNLSRFFYTLHFFLTRATNAEIFWTDATHAIHSKIWPTPPPNHPGYLRYPLYLADSTRDCI